MCLQHNLGYYLFPWYSFLFSCTCGSPRMLHGEPALLYASWMNLWVFKSSLVICYFRKERFLYSCTCGTIHVAFDACWWISKRSIYSHDCDIIIYFMGRIQEFTIMGSSKRPPIERVYMGPEALSPENVIIQVLDIHHCDAKWERFKMSHFFSVKMSLF